VPPYDRLDAVRLLAPIPFTKEVMASFKHSRNSVLTAVVCTAALRDHLPALEGHSISFLRGIAAENRIDNALYVKVQVPFRKRLRLYDVISEDTKVAARDLLKGKSGAGDDEELINWRQQLHHAFRIAALPMELLDTNSIATYIGALSRRQVESLRFNTRDVRR
jgi:hypothetical protein